MQVSVAHCSDSSFAPHGRNYSVHPEKLPQYDEKVKAFFEEHIHDAEVCSCSSCPLEISERPITRTNTGNPLHLGRQRLLRRAEQEGSVGPYSHQGGGSYDATGGDLPPIHRG